MSEELKAKTHRIMEEAYNKGNLDVLGEFYAANIVRHHPPMPNVEGLEALKQFVADLRSAYSNLQITIDEIITEGDKLSATRFTFRGTHTGQSPTIPIPPTGKQIEMTGCIVARFADSKIVEEWSYSDYLGLLQQLGVVPSPEQG